MRKALVSTVVLGLALGFGLAIREPASFPEPAQQGPRFERDTAAYQPPLTGSTTLVSSAGGGGAGYVCTTYSTSTTTSTTPVTSYVQQ